MISSFKKFQFLSLLLITGFFSNSILADSIPATLQSSVTGTLCDATNYAPQASGSIFYPTGVTGINVDCPDNLSLAHTKHNGDPCVYLQAAAGSPTGAFGVFHCTSNANNVYAETMQIGDKSQVTQDTYICSDPAYPTLNGSLCDAIVEPYCGTDLPVYIAPSYLPHDRICVSMNDGVSSCEYTATTESSGTNNGISFTPSSESCGCEIAGTIPCTNESDSLGNTPPDANNCVETGGVSWCQSDPEERCNDVNGITQCDTNCGYINDVFYCGDNTLPDGSACIANDTRAICVGVPQGDCPAGYDCSGNNDGQTTEPTDNAPCTLNDFRPSCVGQPEGSIPQVDTSAIESLLAQGNANTAQIAENTSDISNQIGSGDLSSFDSEMQANQAAIDSALADSDSELTDFVGESSTGETALTASISATGDYFKGFVTDLTPQPTNSCVPYVADFGTNKTITVDICDTSAIIKTMISWLLNFFLALYLFDAIVNRTQPAAREGSIS